MLWIYFDASALIKRFTVETGTDQINEVFRHIPTSQMACSNGKGGGSGGVRS